MVWARLDDKFHGNEKALAVSLAATGLWTRCLSYAADKLTDGRVPASVIRLHAGSKSAALTRELVDAGLFEQHEDGSLWLHDYLDYNPSQDEVERDRVGSAKRQAKFRETRRESRRSNGVMGSVSNTVTPPVTNGPVTDAPVTRNPIPDEKGALPAPAREEPPPYKPFWDAYCDGTDLTPQSPEYLAVEAESGRQLRTHVDPAVTSPEDVRLAAAYLTRHIWPARGLNGRPTLAKVMSAIGEAKSWEANGRPSVASARASPGDRTVATRDHIVQGKHTPFGLPPTTASGQE